MRPAFSVIFLTTLIGAGQGLFLALFGVEAAAAWGGWQQAPGPQFYVVGDAIALGLLAGGLVASVFHLGRPSRAWRAVSQWRTSWLSRECIVLPMCMAAIAAHGWAHYAGSGGTLVLGAAGAVACLGLYVCTGMVYAAIRFLQEWATPLTLVNFTLLGCASGFTLATAFAAAWTPELARPLGSWAILFTAAGLAARLASLRRNSRIRRRSTVQSAIGVQHPRVRQKAQGFMGGSFNTREFFHGQSVRAVRAIKWTFLVLAFPVPVLMLWHGMTGDILADASNAFVIQYLGLLAERWFFLAQAAHPQNLYYQAVS